MIIQFDWFRFGEKGVKINVFFLNSVFNFISTFNAKIIILLSEAF